MTERHTPHPWEEALDRQLREALAVDPSPEFRSKVRTRLDEEPVPSRLRGMASILAAAAAIAVVVMAGAIGGRWWNAEPAPLRVASRATTPAAAPYAASIVPRTVEATPDRRQAAAVRAGSAADAVPERVSAQFAPEERDAFRLFVRLARSGTLPVPEALPLAGAGVDTLPAIYIPPIEIPPVIADAGEGVTQ